jgi:hypothetical protein
MYHTEIRVKGKINPSWSDWFGELEIQEEADETLLSGKLPDMAAVYGVISRLGSLVIPLISVRCVEESEAGIVKDHEEINGATHACAHICTSMKYSISETVSLLSFV